ncbi:MAG: DUF2752 domain-containing protein [Lachnospiraceae bacterium]|nr:DUF2752 domain-containing protein [Lachnospiraceae bacterium]
MDKIKQFINRLLEPGYELTLTKKQRTVVLVGLPILLGLIGLGILWLKINTPYSVKCPIYETTGFYCATCGVTRQAVALLNGDIYQAFRYNILTFTIILPTVIIYIKESIKFIKFNEFSNYLDYILYGYLIVFIAFMLLRNTEWFSWLAPTEILLIKQ